MRNHAKPFMKVELPAGAQLLSAEVEGERVKPVEGIDGSRVPLLRAGLDSSKAYTVSFVYISSGARFAKSGAYDMGLAKLDIPVNLLTWEVSLPDQLVVRQFGGNALSADLIPAAVANTMLQDGGDGNDTIQTPGLKTTSRHFSPDRLAASSLIQHGAVIPNADVTVRTRKQVRL